MTATTNIDKAETITNPTTTCDGQGAGNTAPNTGKQESELRAAARRHGLTMKELAHLMGVNAGYLSDVANGRRPWTPMMRERVMAVLGEVPGQGIVYRQGGVITGGEQLHPGAGPGEGPEHEGLGRHSGGVLRLHDAGGPGPPEHEPVGPGQGRECPGRPGQGGVRSVRQPAGEHRQRRQQLYPGTGKGAGHEHGGAGGPGRGVSRLHVGRGPGPPELEPSHAGAGWRPCWTLPSGWRPPSPPPWPREPCGTVWMPTGTARMKLPGWRASARLISPRS